MKYSRMLISPILLILFNLQAFGADIGIANREIIVKGNIGSADGEFGYKVFKDRSWVEPSAIAIDSKGNIYIADPLNYRIQKFNVEGKYVTKITFEAQDETFAFTINDLVIDNEDNLYILSKRGQKILKYDSKGRIIQSINLADYMLPERLDVDVLGNMYVFGTVLVKVPGRGNANRGDCLRKLDKNGRLIKEWNNASLPFINQEGYVYIRQDAAWKKYDEHEKYLGDVKCEAERQKVSFEKICYFPPVFVDGKKASYYFVYSDKTEKPRTLLKLSLKGELRTLDLSSIEIWPWPRVRVENMIKFDRNGNLYGYGYDEQKKLYWITRINIAD